MNEKTTSESPSFSVMTWNLFALPLFLNKDALQRMERVKQTLDKNCSRLTFETRFSSINKDDKKKPGLGKHPDHILALGVKAKNNTILDYREIVPELGFLSDHLPVRASIHI